MEKGVCDVCVLWLSRPDTLDPALMRPGRMDRKVEFGLPDLEVGGEGGMREWGGRRKLGASVDCDCLSVPH